MIASCGAGEAVVEVVIRRAGRVIADEKAAAIGERDVAAGQPCRRDIQEQDVFPGEATACDADAKIRAFDRSADIGRADDALIEAQYIGAGVERDGLTIEQCTEPIQRHGTARMKGNCQTLRPGFSLVYGRSGSVAQRRHARRALAWLGRTILGRWVARAWACARLPQRLFVGCTLRHALPMPCCAPTRPWRARRGRALPLPTRALEPDASLLTR